HRDEVVVLSLDVAHNLTERTAFAVEVENLNRSADGHNRSSVRPSSLPALGPSLFRGCCSFSHSYVGHPCEDVPFKIAHYTVRSALTTASDGGSGSNLNRCLCRCSRLR